MTAAAKAAVLIELALMFSNAYLNAQTGEVADELATVVRESGATRQRIFAVIGEFTAAAFRLRWLMHNAEYWKYTTVLYSSGNTRLKFIHWTFLFAKQIPMDSQFE